MAETRGAERGLDRFEGFTDAAFAIGLFLSAFFWMLKWFYVRPGNRLIDGRLAPEFVDRLTRRWGLATLGYFAAIPIAFFQPRLAVGLSLAIVASSPAATETALQKRTRADRRREDERLRSTYFFSTRPLVST